MKLFTAALCTLVLLSASLCGPLVARADGPTPPKNTPYAEAGQCAPIKGSKACKQTFRTFTVNKADGSGSTKVALIEDRTLTYAKIVKTASTLGEPLPSKNDSYTKSTMEKSAYRGGSVCLNRSRSLYKWISALRVMPQPGLAAAR